VILDFKFSHASLGKKILYVIFQLLLITYAIAVIFPVLNMFLSSFKATREIFLNPFSLPKQWRYNNYIKVWKSGGFNHYFINSIVVTAVSIFFVVLFGSMAANGISRYAYKFRILVYLLFLSGIVLPLKAAIIPLFILMERLRLTNTRIGLMLIFTAMGLPSTVFILSGFMKSIPKELEYAARIDGCNDFTIYSNVIIPLSMASITLVTIYNVVPIWNDFFFPLVFISSENKRTLPLGVAAFFGQYQIEWDSIFAALSISIVPMIVVYIFMSKYFIKGMTAGAVKG
jgi:raffinose/stachyose/melibiose transport system permease protein